MPTIAHISDLHLQSGNPERQAQIEPILQKINAMKPDLVVISGDVTDDGWDSIEELKWAKDWLEERVDVFVWSLPGNHDVGNFANLSEGQINNNRFDLWSSVFDPTELGFAAISPWIFLGVNSMTFGSGLECEQQHFEQFERELNMAIRAKTNLALFLHTPLFIISPSESPDPATDYWLGPKDARIRIWEMIQLANIKLIGSGHVHQTRLTEIDGVKIAWAPPASGTWVHAPGLPNPPMPEKTGFFLHHLHDDGSVETELVECAPMLKCIEFNPWP